MEDSECMVPDIPLAKCDEDCSSGSESIFDQNHHIKNKKCDEITSSCSSAENSENPYLTCSLQDLIQSFDHDVKTVFTNMEESTNEIAPVPVRLPKEMISSESEWWTLTGNYGNLPPIDFSNAQIRKRQSNGSRDQSNMSESSIGEDIGFDEDRDEEDLQKNNESGFSGSIEQPPITADQVIEEIMKMMQGDLSDKSMPTKTDESSTDSMYSSVRSPLNNETSLSQSEYFKHRRFVSKDLKNMPYEKLLSIHAETEQLISTNNAELVNELAHRDEQEYEKEVKNKFITLVVEIQERRKKFQGDTKKKIFGKVLGQGSQSAPHSLMAVIPFNEERVQTHLDMHFIEAINRILESVLNESPQVPNLLTEYILNVVCPPNNSD